MAQNYGENSNYGYDSGLRRSHWWQEDKDCVHSAVFGAVEHLDQVQDARRAANIHFLRLYSNRMASVLSGQDFASSIGDGSQIRFNIVKSAVDTAVAQIGTKFNKVLFQTYGGTYAQRKKAERLSKFVFGWMWKLGIYPESLRLFMDAGIFGDCFLKFFTDRHNGIGCERAFPDDVIIDDNDGRDGSPRAIFHPFQCDRSVLMDLYDSRNAKEAIKNSKVIRDDDSERNVKHKIPGLYPQPELAQGSVVIFRYQ